MNIVFGFSYIICVYICLYQATYGDVPVAACVRRKKGSGGSTSCCMGGQSGGQENVVGVPQVKM